MASQPRRFVVTFRSEERPVEAIYEGDGAFDWWLADLPLGTWALDLNITGEEYADVEHQLGRQMRDEAVLANVREEIRPEVEYALQLAQASQP